MPKKIKIDFENLKVKSFATTKTIHAGAMASGANSPDTNCKFRTSDACPTEYCHTVDVHYDCL